MRCLAWGVGGRHIRRSRSSVCIAVRATHSTHSRIRTRHRPLQKYVPLDLRVKKTRAMRRRLTKHQAAARTEKQVKKARAFPRRKYAVKA